MEFIKLENAEEWCALGDRYKKENNLSDALEAFEKALQLEQTSFQALEGMAVVHHMQNRFSDAIACYEKCLSMHPHDVISWNNLGSAFWSLGRYAKALSCFRRAIEIDPESAYSFRNFGRAQQSLGDFDAAIDAFRHALKIKPDYAEAFSSLLFCLSHMESADPSKTYDAHRAFGERFETPLSNRTRFRHENAPEPSRRLRLGFVSADLYHHAVAHFIEPIWESLNRDAFEILVYANRAHEDQTTLRLKKLADDWAAVNGLSDEALTRRIRQDRVDILFDLSGHTPDNRLLVFARKPAPVQVSWIGYPNTTGLRAMDYRIVDCFVAPPGMLDRYFTETLLYVPSAGAFKPVESAPQVNPLPALKRGHITFGSFNRVNKLGKSVIPLWSRVLSSIRGSRLLVGAVDDPELQDGITQSFWRCGIAEDRLDFRPKRPVYEYLAMHHEVDILLDTFPYTSGTVANHGLWMGVPTLTLAGRTMPQRLSAAHLGRAGLGEWAAESEDDYVAEACYWSDHVNELARLRSRLRDQLRNSPLRKPDAVTAGIEVALRQVWEKWCEEQIR